MHQCFCKTNSSYISRTDPTIKILNRYNLEDIKVHLWNNQFGKQILISDRTSYWYIYARDADNDGHFEINRVDGTAVSDYLQKLKDDSILKKLFEAGDYKEMRELIREVYDNDK